MRNTALRVRERRALNAEFATQLDRLIADIRSRAKKQFAYSIKINLRKGILKPDEVVENAIVSGITSAVSTRYECGIEPVIRLAVSMLEDVNAHTEAKALAACARAQNLDVAAPLGATLNGGAA